jgi:hypothetical protein
VALQLRVETAGLCSECGRIKVMTTAVASKTTCKASNLYVVDRWSVLLLAFDDAAHAGDNHVQDRLRRVSANHHFYPDAADTVDEPQALSVVPLQRVAVRTLCCFKSGTVVSMLATAGLTIARRRNVIGIECFTPRRCVAWGTSLRCTVYARLVHSLAHISSLVPDMS